MWFKKLFKIYEKNLSRFLEDCCNFVLSYKSYQF